MNIKELVQAKPNHFIFLNRYIIIHIFTYSTLPVYGASEQSTVSGAGRAEISLAPDSGVTAPEPKYLVFFGTGSCFQIFCQFLGYFWSFWVLFCRNFILKVLWLPILIYLKAKYFFFLREKIVLIKSYVKIALPVPYVSDAGLELK